MGRKAPRKRLACRVMCRPNGCSAEHPNVSRRSVHPSIRVSEAKVQDPGAKMRRGNEMVGCMVSSAIGDARPHPEERAYRRSSPNSKARTRLSKDEDVQLSSPSCFETHRSARSLWKHLRWRRAAMLLSMRARPVLGERSQQPFGQTTPRGRTNLRLWEAITGAIPLFPDCYLQWMAQLQRVGHVSAVQR